MSGKAAAQLACRLCQNSKLQQKHHPGRSYFCLWQVAKLNDSGVIFFFSVLLMPETFAKHKQCCVNNNNILKPKRRILIKGVNTEKCLPFDAAPHYPQHVYLSIQRLQMFFETDSKLKLHTALRGRSPLLAMPPTHHPSLCVYGQFLSIYGEKDTCFFIGLLLWTCNVNLWPFSDGSSRKRKSAIVREWLQSVWLELGRVSLLLGLEFGRFGVVGFVLGLTVVKCSG